MVFFTVTVMIASESKDFKTHTSLTHQTIYATFCNIATFIASLLCLMDLILKLQDFTVKELCEPGAVAEGLYTQEKPAEETVIIHSRVT
jgi:hypothetical protein